MNYKTIIFITLISSSLLGCGKFEQYLSHKKSSIFGLNRVATVYSYDGKPIKSWTFDSQVEWDNGVPRFMVNGKAVNVVGGVLVIEEK